MKCLLSIILVASAAYPHLSNAFPLGAVQNELLQIRKAGKTPVAIFDLDETLVHSAKRKTMALIKAVERNRDSLASRWPNETRGFYQRLTYAGDQAIRGLQNQYDMNELARNLGVYGSPEFVKALENLAMPIYLSDEFIYLDSPYQGAIQLLSSLYHLRGKVYFVSSRFKVLQKATEQNLGRNNMFVPQQSVVILRNNGEDSLSFKKRAFSAIKSSLRSNEVVAMVGENEPENLNAMVAQFPTAISVFVTGAILNNKVLPPHSANLIVTRHFIRD